MKRLIYICLFINFLSFPSIAISDTLKVITKENVIRKENRFFSPVLCHVRYGDIMEYLEKEGDWYRVRFKKMEGWIHKTVVEKRKMGLGGILGGKGARHEEVALAGKGFNPDIERSYRNKHPEARYHLVDRIEGIKVSEGEVKSFIKAGGLKIIE